MTAPVVLLGGTGDVGRRVVPLLLDHTDCPIILASRQGGADADRVRQIQLDVRAPEAAKQIPSGATVINLTEATPPALAAEIVRKGGVFLDTSADADYVAALDEAMSATGGPGTGIVCVGTAPGLTTLMAAHVARPDAVTFVDIGIELGMGRHYGPAATEWFFHAIGKPYQVDGPHGPRTQVPGAERRRFAFADQERSRLALGIGFPHQGISQTGKVLAVHSYLAVSPLLVTHAVAGLLRLGLGAALARRARPLTRIMLALPALGQAHTRLVAVSTSQDGKEIARCRFAAGDQADLTAAIIVSTLLAVRARGDCPSGVTTITDHLTLQAAHADLQHFLPDMPMEMRIAGLDPEEPQGINRVGHDPRQLPGGVPDDARRASSRR